MNPFNGIAKGSCCLMRILAVVAFLWLQGTEARAQLMITEGDTIDIGKGEISNELPTLFLSNEGVISETKLTTDSLEKYKEYLFNRKDLMMEDYMSLAFAFSEYEDYWPQALRCSLTSMAYANYFLRCTGLGGFSDELVNEFNMLGIQQDDYLARHLEDDTETTLAQIDSVEVTLRRLDYIGNIYKKENLQAKPEEETKAILEALLRGMTNRDKTELNKRKEQMSVIRSFIRDCNTNKTDPKLMQKVTMPYTTVTFQPPTFDKTDLFLPEPYWDKWSAEDKTKTYIVKIDDFTYSVILTQGENVIRDDMEAPIASKVFTVWVSHPTNSKTWRIDKVETLEHYLKWKQESEESKKRALERFREQEKKQK